MELEERAENEGTKVAERAHKAQEQLRQRHANDKAKYTDMGAKSTAAKTKKLVKAAAGKAATEARATEARRFQGEVDKAAQSGEFKGFLAFRSGRSSRRRRARWKPLKQLRERRCPRWPRPTRRD